MESPENYHRACLDGRDEALRDIATARQADNLPFLARKIREAAADPSGRSIGYLFALSEAAMS